MDLFKNKMHKYIAIAIVAISTFFIFYQNPLIPLLVWFTVMMTFIGFRQMESNAYSKQRDEYIAELESKLEGKEQDTIIDEVKEKKAEIKIPQINTGHGGTVWTADSKEDAIAKIDALISKGKRK
jgi:c-di-AMP phosphodiesterase-like protein